MQSVLLSNPIYQHSGETEKLASIAQQASVNEDQEQRRRQLDKTGEQRRLILAKEVSHLFQAHSGEVHLKNTPYTPHAQPILEQAQQGLQHAQQTATNVLASALETGKSLLNSATTAVQNVANSALDTAASALDTATAVGQDVAAKANIAAHEAAQQASNIATEAAHQASNIATEAAHQASNLASKAVDVTSATAAAVSQKTKAIASVGLDKAQEVADNISHFTTLVGVLAEEENERARRLTSGDEARAALNAFKVSELIRGLGEAFYKQTPNLLYATTIVEEAERRWRLNSSASGLAENNAHREGKLVKKNLQNFMPRYQWVKAHISTLEEKERTRRLNDPAESYAIINALNLSFLIKELGLGFYRQEGAFSRKHASYATTLLEENERRDRIRTHNLHHLSEPHSFLTDLISDQFQKLNFNTRNATKFANEFASLLGNATLKVASQVSSMTKDLAGAAAERVKGVAGDIKTFSATMYVIALEEKERARRLSDPLEFMAINNAWLQSQLIRDLSSLYRPTRLPRYPLGLIEESERRWRLATISPNASRIISSIVLANAQKFELAMERAAIKESAHRDAIQHSRLNPLAPAFVPHQASFAKVEPAPAQSLRRAAGAQL